MAHLTRLATLGLALAAAPAASAGIVDGPLPLLAGQPTKHVFSVPGIVTQGPFAAVFLCTSAERDEPVWIGVEVFDDRGDLENDVAAGEGAVELAPGDTAVIATSNTAAFVEDAIVGVGVIGGGSARIVATSMRILCSALLSDFSAAPPTSMAPLTIVAKTTQKAAN